MAIGEDGPVGRIEQGRKHPCSDHRGQRPVSGQQQDDVQDDGARQQGGRHDEVVGVVGPPPPGGNDRDPFPREQGEDRDRGSKGLPIVHPIVVLEGGTKGNGRDRRHDRPPLPILPVQPEVPVPRQQVEVHVERADDGDEQNRNEVNVVDVPGHRDAFRRQLRGLDNLIGSKHN